jgi:hypothetical protein
MVIRGNTSMLLENFWGGNDIGNPNAKLVMVDAVSESCHKCGCAEDFIVVVEDNRIQYVELNNGKYDFPYNDCFIVINEVKARFYCK